MGKLNGILPIEGTVGKITFTKTKEGIVVREKGGISASRIASDPAFRRTRENNQEFGNAGKTARMILTAIRETARAKADSRATGRLMKLLMAALKSDTVSKRGHRKITNGSPAMLEGFDMNVNATLAGTLYAPYMLTTDRASGSFEISFPGIVNADSIKAPAGATDFSIAASCVVADFDGLVSTTTSATSSILQLANANSITPLQGTFTAGTTLPLLVTLSISFFQEVNGDHYLLSNGAYNPAAIIKVDV